MLKVHKIPSGLSFPVVNLAKPKSSSLMVVVVVAVQRCSAVDSGWVADGVKELWKTKLTEKTSNSMSRGLKADGREAGGGDAGWGPTSHDHWTKNPSHHGGWSWSVVEGVLKGHTEHAGNSVPFNVPSERAQLTPGTIKSRGMRLC